MSGVDEISIGQLVADELAVKGVRPEAFRQIIGRLLGLSILHRDDSTIERQLYDDAVRVEAVVTVEYLNATLAAQARRPLPARTAREKLFADLKRARLIDYRADSEAEDADALIAIRGTILQFVSDAAVDAMLADVPPPDASANTPESSDEA